MEPKKKGTKGKIQDKSVDQKTSGEQPEKLSSEDYSLSVKKYLSIVGVGKRYHDAILKRTKIQNELKTLIDNLDGHIKAGRGMVILGSVGTGKTCCLVVLIKAFLCKNGYRVLGDTENTLRLDFSIVFTRSSDLFNLICEKKEPFIDKCLNANILMIDDFGQEYDHDFPFSKFEDLVEYRYANQLSTFVTSNLTPDALINKNKYQRVVDRWRECNDIIQIIGPSMRRQQS